MFIKLFTKKVKVYNENNAIIITTILKHRSMYQCKVEVAIHNSTCSLYIWKIFYINTYEVIYIGIVIDIWGINIWHFRSVNILYILYK